MLVYYCMDAGSRQALLPGVIFTHLQKSQYYRGEKPILQETRPLLATHSHTAKLFSFIRIKNFHGLDWMLRTPEHNLCHRGLLGIH